MDKYVKSVVWDPYNNGPLKSSAYIEPPAQEAEVNRLKRNHYRDFDFPRFIERVAHFETLDFSDPDLDLVREVENVLRQNPESGYLLATSWQEIGRGHLLWRAREMSIDSLEQNLVTPSDLWEAPKEFVGAGRLNAANEPILYTTFEAPFGTLKEARITEPGKTFILMAYEVLSPIIVRRIGVTNPDEALPRHYREIETCVSRFVAETLSIPAVHDSPKLYKFTRKLLRTLYRLEDGWEVGWGYASTIVGPELLNIAIEPVAAHAQLEVAAVLMGQVEQPRNGQMHLSLHGYSNGRAKADGKLRFKEFPHAQLESLEDYLSFAI